MIVGEIYQDTKYVSGLTGYLEYVGCDNIFLYFIPVGGWVPYRVCGIEGWVRFPKYEENDFYEATELKELVESVLNNENE